MKKSSPTRIYLKQKFYSFKINKQKPVDEKDSPSLGHNQACELLGIGSMKNESLDGSTKILREVMYILNHRKNLILLEMLDSVDYVYKAQDGVI